MSPKILPKLLIPNNSAQIDGTKLKHPMRHKIIVNNETSNKLCMY